jgi:AcrR family transcriptional regulator
MAVSQFKVKLTHTPKKYSHTTNLILIAACCQAQTVAKDESDATYGAGRNMAATRALVNSRPMRRQKSEDRRKELVLSAAEVLLFEGVHGTTTRVLASRLGVNLATLHYYFEDKNELLLEIYKSIGEDHRSFLTVKMAEPSPIRRRIADLLGVIWQAVEDQREQELIVYEMAIYGIRNEAFAASTRLMQEEWLSHYRDILAQATDLDPAASGTDINGVANLCFTGFTGIILQWLITGDLERARDSVKVLIQSAQMFVAPKTGVV